MIFLCWTSNARIMSHWKGFLYLSENCILMLVAQSTNVRLAPYVPACNRVVSTPIIMSLLPSVSLTDHSHKYLLR